VDELGVAVNPDHRLSERRLLSRNIFGVENIVLRDFDEVAELFVHVQPYVTLFRGVAQIPSQQ
jgi:hypothetical protein